MSVLREELLERAIYIQQYREKNETEIETKISGLLSCLNFMINVQRTSQRTDTSTRMHERVLQFFATCVTVHSIVCVCVYVCSRIVLTNLHMCEPA